MSTELNTKYEYCGYGNDSSDKEFLGFIYARLNSRFGENPNSGYMERLEKYIDSLKGKMRIGCDCSCGDICPQGKRGVEVRCSIWKE